MHLTIQVYVTLASALIHHPLCIKNVNSGFHSTTIYLSDFCSAEIGVENRKLVI